MYSDEIESIHDVEDNDLNQDDSEIQKQNEITLKSISELHQHEYFSTKNNENRRLDQLFQRSATIDRDLSSGNDETDESRTSISISQNRIRQHSLIKLPQQLNTSTKVHLKKIDSHKHPQESWHHKARKNTYNFLNHPAGYISYGYHISMALIFIFYLGFIIFTSRTTWEENCFIYGGEHFLKSLFERLLFLHFLIEFILRFWCSRAQSSYKKLSYFGWIWHYYRRPSHIFDMLLLIGGFMSASCCIQKLPVDFTQDLYALITLRGFHRLFNVIQWTSIRSRESPWTVLYEVFNDGGHLLFAMFNMVLMFIFLVAYGVYIAETHPDRDHSLNDTKINNLMDSLYATSITLLTIGYGDLSPITYAGQALMGISIWLALALFALPSGLIGTSVALKVTEQEEHRKCKIRKTLAAIMIQRAWRLARRQRQFDFVQTLNHMRQTSVIERMELPIKTEQTLWDQIDHVMENRINFFVSQFIQFLLLRIARKKFRQFALPIDPRPLIKSYWNKNRETVSILEQAHDQLEDIVVKMQKQFLDFDQMEIKLIMMEQKIIQQNQILKQILGFDKNPNISNNKQVTYL